MTGRLFDTEPSGRRADGDFSPATPLADRMRPRSLDEVEGPEAVVGANGFLRRAISEDRVPSLILWGPPGVGKTTLARLIASQTSSLFLSYSAVATGVKEMREVLEEAQRLRARNGKRTILFLDEIHRFNRSQQDVFLPYVEAGDVVLIGATTENPSFELNGALLSRCKVVVLEPLAPEAIARIVERALRDISRGLGARDFQLDDDSLSFIAQAAGGDARRALNLVEAAAADAEADKVKRIDVARLRDLLQRKVLLYDKAGEEHYNLISALHKSMRESDPDAAIYWLVRMLEAGRIPSTWRGGSCGLPPRTSAWRIRGPCGSRSTPKTPTTSSVCRRARSPWRRPRSTAPSLPSPTPSTRPRTRPSATWPSARPSRCLPSSATP